MRCYSWCFLLASAISGQLTHIWDCKIRQGSSTVVRKEGFGMCRSSYLLQLSFAQILNVNHPLHQSIPAGHATMKPRESSQSIGTRTMFSVMLYNQYHFFPACVTSCICHTRRTEQCRFSMNSWGLTGNKCSRYPMVPLFLWLGV